MSFTPRDMVRLRGGASKHTHLSRYDVAQATKAKQVLDVSCPDCKVLPDHMCVVLRTPLQD